jgi:hypothetical protein
MKIRVSLVSVFSTVILAAIGCAEQSKPTPAPATETAQNGEHTHKHSDGEHAHPEHGPHGGDIVELGKEEYHAEVVHDEASGTVTIYVLDSAAKKSVPIDADHVTINVKHDGKGEQFEVKSSPQEGDGDGKSSRFTSEDKELAKDLDHEARLVIEIAGKSYTGEIKHGHDHKHADHKK